MSRAFLLLNANGDNESGRWYIFTQEQLDVILDRTIRVVRESGEDPKTIEHRVSAIHETRDFLATAVPGQVFDSWTPNHCNNQYVYCVDWPAEVAEAYDDVLPDGSVRNAIAPLNEYGGN